MFYTYPVAASSGNEPARVEPPWWPKPKPSRRRQPLSRDAIVEAALKILDAEGINALTVRRLGEELNTGSATLYWHIGSKDDLAELVYDHVMGELELPRPDPARWQEQLKSLARDLYRLLLRHNDLVLLSLGHIPVGPNSLRVIEWGIDLLRRAGAPDHAAAYFGDILGRFIDASVLEVTARGGPPIEMVGEYFRSLSPQQYPSMMGIMSAMFSGSDEERFEFGLDLLVRGLASYIDDANGR